MSIEFNSEKRGMGQYDRCCGCGACVDTCPVEALRMRRDEYGFLYPYLDDSKCIHCNKCSKVCDFKSRASGNDNISIKCVYGFVSLSSETLIHSSSGGAFSALSDYVLKNNGIVIGSVMGTESEAFHTVADNSVERDRMRGSKYVQSDLRDTYSITKDALKQGRYVLFTGTPCQIAGLNRALGELSESEKLLTCDVICHGAMSPLVLKKYHEYIEKKKRKRITGHIFRYKKAGWDHIECLLYQDGTIDYKSVYSQLYKRLFDVGLGIRPSCFNCPYATLNRVGDISLGDFWGDKESNEEVRSSQGISLVMVNTQKGMDAFDRMKTCGYYYESDINAAIFKQPHLKKPISQHKDNMKFWDFILKNEFEEAVKLCGYNPDWAEIKRIIKKIIFRIN